MAKTETTPRQFFAGAALAYAIGIVYTVILFHAILGPGMLVVGTVFLVLGLRKQKKAKRSGDETVSAP